MTIKEAVQFELDHNFKVSKAISKGVMVIISEEFDLNESAYGSFINFYELVDETIYTILN